MNSKELFSKAMTSLKSLNKPDSEIPHSKPKTMVGVKGGKRAPGSNLEKTRFSDKIPFYKHKKTTSNNIPFSQNRF
jgi:hypothetical protein